VPYANGVGVEQELPEDVAQEVARATNEQIDRPTVTEKVEVKSGRATSKPKRERAK
jgi:hypothetical protein